MFPVYSFPKNEIVICAGCTPSSFIYTYTYLCSNMNVDTVYLLLDRQSSEG